MDVISFSEAATANSRIEIINANPDSTSGIVTVPKTIASGETITIPAGRVAVLPNLVIDGVLNIENGGEVFIPSGATLGDLDAQLALKADTSYVNAQLSLKANTADLKEIGVGQTWQDVTASRVAGTTYTNSTGKPIVVKCIQYVALNDATYRLEMYVNNVMIDQSMAYVGGYPIGLNLSGTIIVPNGSTYKVDNLTPTKWFELR